jgi:hypothetical protein
MDVLNVKDKRGKIQNPEQNGSAFCISPYHPNFITQVENGVWPYVKLMLDKNYFTINSCEGHHIEDSLEITFVFYDYKKMDKFVKYFKHPLIHVVVEDRFINEFNKYKFEHVDKKEEIKILNNMFMMTNEDYKFVTVFANKEWMHKKENYLLYCFKKIIINKYSEYKLYALLEKMPNYECL